jgi:hypothetical protein
VLGPDEFMPNLLAANEPPTHCQARAWAHHGARSLEGAHLAVGDCGLRLVQIQASSAADRDRLMHELAAYKPKRAEGFVLFELEDDSQKDVLALLFSIEKCLIANDISSVRVELDGENYLLAAT